MLLIHQMELQLMLVLRRFLGLLQLPRPYVTRNSHRYQELACAKSIGYSCNVWRVLMKIQCNVCGCLPVLLLSDRFIWTSNAIWFLYVGWMDNFGVPMHLFLLEGCKISWTNWSWTIPPVFWAALLDPFWEGNLENTLGSSRTVNG